MPLDVFTFTERFPEFADAEAYPVNLVSLVLAAAARRVSTSVFGEGDAYDDALGYMAAHLLLSTPNAAAGTASGPEVASVSAGPISVTYRDSGGASAASSSNLESTSYGREFRAMARLYAGAMAV